MFSHSIRNELTQLPESLTNLINLDKLILSYNKLSSLPKSKQHILNPQLSHHTVDIA